MPCPAAHSVSSALKITSVLDASAAAAAAAALHCMQPTHPFTHAPLHCLCHPCCCAALLLLLQVSQYLEAYLWPHFDAATASDAHVLSLVALVNEKFRQGVPAWAAFHTREVRGALMPCPVGSAARCDCCPVTLPPCPFPLCPPSSPWRT